MTERERLIELLIKVDQMRLMRQGIDECANYLLKNGVIVLPVEVSDTIYGLTKGGVRDLQVEQIHCWSSGIWKFNCWSGKGKYRVGYEISVDDFGETVFLTREEAEAKLKEGE